MRVLNALGRAARVPLVRLDAARLLSRAQRACGLEDFGGDAFREPLERLLTALEHEARLTLLGRLVAREQITGLLENRLRMTAERARHPEIDAGAVPAPIFVLGLPRTGTTILHQLLAQDAANRTPMTWEVAHPWPPPERATFETDPRIAAVDRQYARFDRLLPGFQAIHPMGARLPQECVALTAHDFASMMFHCTYRVPSYQSWLDRQDLRWVYAAFRRQLQYLQWRCPAERWVLKSPGHLWALDALLDVFPDARIVQTHRDPVTVAASLVSLLATLRSVATDDIDPHEIGADWTPRLADGLARTMAVRERRLTDPDRVFDVPFAEFMRDEVGMVRRIYEHFGLPLAPPVEERMRGFLAAHHRERHGAHRYTLAAAGLDPVAARRRFACYQARFAVPSETAPRQAPA